MGDFTGTAGNDTLTGTTGNDTFDVSQGGSDTVNGGDGNDTFRFGSSLDSQDVVDGGSGFDVLIGTYDAGGTKPAFIQYELGSTPSNALNRGLSLTSIESLSLTTGAGSDDVQYTIPTTAGGYGAHVPYYNGGAGFDWFAISFFYSSGFQGVPPYPIVTGYNLPHNPGAFAAWQLLPDGSKGEMLVQADNVEKFTIIGTSLDDQINGTFGDDVIAPVYGNDVVRAGDGDDFISFDNLEFNAKDAIDGGPGYDQVWLSGPYQYSPLYLTSTTLTNVELLKSMASGTLHLATADATVAAGQDLKIDAADQLSGSSLDFNGTAETDGTFTVIGSSDADSIVGGACGDTFQGGRGNDHLDGGANVDTAVFSGKASAYALTQTSTIGVWTVTGPDGTDTLFNIEYAKFDDQTLRLLPGTGTSVDFAAASTAYMANIRDFDGKDVGGTSSWRLAGTADVNGDGTAEHIFFNRAIGRWAEIGTEADGKTYFSNYGWAGDTRVVGLYIDPLVANGTVVKGSDTDSQRRFQNDLQIDNIKGILGQNDYNKDGLQEIYFSLTDGTAYLHAYMHADGNIQYANYQSKQQVIDYLASNGVASSAYANWFPTAQTAMTASSLSSDLGNTLVDSLFGAPA